MEDLAGDAGRTRPKLLLCGFEPRGAALEEAVAAAVRRVVEGPQPKVRGRLCGMLAPPTWLEAAEAVLEASRDCACAGVLLVAARPAGTRFEVLMRSSNRGSRRKLDAAGAPFGRERIFPVGPGVARATAPVPAMVSALKAARLPAAASSESGDDLTNYALHRLLTEFGDAPQGPDAGALLVPGRLGEDGDAVTSSDIETAVRAAAAAFADALRPSRAYA